VGGGIRGGTRGRRHTGTGILGNESFFKGDRHLAEPGNRGTDIHDRSIPATPPALSPPRPQACPGRTKCLTPNWPGGAGNLWGQAFFQDTPDAARSPRSCRNHPDPKSVPEWTHGGETLQRPCSRREARGKFTRRQDYAGTGYPVGLRGGDHEHRDGPSIRIQILSHKSERSVKELHRSHGCTPAACTTGMTLKRAPSFDTGDRSISQGSGFNLIFLYQQGDPWS
jgi:hypothetical protein